MAVFVTYMLLGLSLAAPIGPVNAAQLDRGIKNGFLHSWLVGLGATVADGFYMLLVFLGFVHLMDIPFIQVFLWLFGFFVLVYTGIESLLGAREITMIHDDYRKKQTHIKSFFSGFMMSLFNPLTILFWLGIFGSVLAKTVSDYGIEQVILYTGAIFLGIVCWDLTMAFLSSSLKRMMTDRFLFFVSILSGTSLIGFGIYFAIQAFNVLFS